jgi:hypothetical protein
MSVLAARPLNLLRPLLAFAAVAAGLVALFTSSAGAVEKQAFGDLTVREPVEEVSTAAGDIYVEASVDDDVHTGFGDITVRERVGGDVEAVKGDVRIEAPVGGSVGAGFGDVYVNDVVSGDVEVEHGDVYLQPGARVEHDLNCGNCTIHGDKNVVAGDMRAGMASERGGADDDSEILGFVGWFFGTLVFAGLSVLAAVLFPRSVAAAARRVDESPGRSLVYGIVSLPVVAVLFLVLLITIVGSPISLFVVGPLYLVLLLAGIIVVAFSVGRRVVFATGRYRAGNALAAVVGAFLVSLAYAIPFLGGLLLFALTLLGTGAIILHFTSRRGGAYFGG